MQTKTLTFRNIPPLIPKEDVITPPDGVENVAGFWINPNKNYEVSVYSQKTEAYLLNKFNTQIGDTGFIPLSYVAPKNERYIVTITHFEVGDESPFITILLAQTGT